MSTDQSPPPAGEAAPDDAAPAQPFVQVLRGEPTAEELAALVTVFAGAAGGGGEPAAAARNMWGHPVDKLRYSIFSWQRVTLLERTHLRR
ncbi:hypothetical protein BHQ15_03590 [Mycolicibacillus koreensis]|nr:hypothetical protein BHQ15_03590 [Mycolicibacillus koreensis]